MGDIEKIKLNTELIISDIKELNHSKQRKGCFINKFRVNYSLLEYGRLINHEILKNERADYGKQIVQKVSTQLQSDFGKGFSKRNIHNMIKFKQYNIMDSKHIIDILDDLIWEVYGLNKIEIDYLQNYELSYRISND